MSHQVCVQQCPVDAPYISLTSCPPGYKRIGKYFRQNPGCPEYLGLRVNPMKWIQEEGTQLLIKYLEQRPVLANNLKDRDDNELRLGLAYIRARETMIYNTHIAKDGYREIGQMLHQKGEHLLGSWDDHVERLEFYRERTCIPAGETLASNTDQWTRHVNQLWLSKVVPDCR